MEYSYAVGTLRKVRRHESLREPVAAQYEIPVCEVVVPVVGFPAVGVDHDPRNDAVVRESPADYLELERAEIVGRTRYVVHGGKRLELVGAHHEPGGFARVAYEVDGRNRE